MGLHQKITDRITSEPCNCGADDDHFDMPTDAEHEARRVALEDWRAIAYPDPDDWTDGTEATE